MHPLPPIGRCRPGVDWILPSLLNPVLLGLANWDSMSGAPAHRTCCVLCALTGSRPSCTMVRRRLVQIQADLSVRVQQFTAEVAGFGMGNR